jgi:hypothetical protein
VRIDRPTEDDTPRAGAADRAAGTAPAAAGNAAPDRVAFAAEYRATVDAAHREHRAAREWDEAVPALREAWEAHEKKWTYTYPERTQPAVDPDIPGAWRGDGGRYLAPDANAEVTRGCARIRELGETVITPAMRRLEAEDPDRHLAGFDHRLKGEERLKEKVADELEARPGLTAAQALSSVPDSVRFTFCYSRERYASGVRADLTRLHAEGFELAKPLRNLWPSDQYMGINTQWREPGTGQRFEVQFHTQASFEAKQLSHGAYERIRNPQTPEPELEELRDFQRQVCGKIPIPPGATEIDDPPRKEHDG